MVATMESFCGSVGFGGFGGVGGGVDSLEHPARSRVERRVGMRILGIMGCSLAVHRDDFVAAATCSKCYNSLLRANWQVCGVRVGYRAALG